MGVLFADTGVQYLCVPLAPDLRFANAGHGWQRCACKPGDKLQEVPFVQWLIRKYGDDNKLFLAVDTTCSEGDSDAGYFSKSSSLHGDQTVSLQKLLGADGNPLEGLPDIEFTIRPATAQGGDAKDVHLVLDFGNSRSGALLLEFRGETATTPIMTPFELIDRYRLDGWNDEGQFVANDAARWFSSRAQWSTAPYLPPPTVERIEYTEEDTKSIWGQKKKTQPVTRRETPDTFQDFSMVRMGREADELALLMNTDGDVRSGVSSPKRYLWADDASWLEGANWHMSDPYDRHNTQSYAATLKGPLLRYLAENDPDVDPEPSHEEAPSMPRHAPRILMVASFYELLCQAYTFINSHAYRENAGDSPRMRRLRSFSLTYPTGMIQAERERLRRQGEKAVKIFAQTLGRKQNLIPELKLSIDEASAVHLTYIWSELQKVGHKARLWFSIMGRDHSGAAPPKTEEEAPAEEAPEASSATGGRRRPGSRLPRSRRVERRAAKATEGRELRIACIDIGGGTTDLMIAKYRCETGIEDRIRGEIIHQDGVSWAGDQLVKRLLECVIVPLFADVVGLEKEDVQRLFGPETPHVRKFRAQRINWINRLFVPLAEVYLRNAVDGVDDEISHTMPEVVSPDVVESLQQTIDQLRGPGYYDVSQELGLRVTEGDVECIVREVFENLLFDFCEQIVKHKADVVLMAGQPSKLQSLRNLVREFLPIHESRIVPMHNYYAGNLYPYQSTDGLSPGKILDPKSSVVVGAAIQFAARHGWLRGFNYAMDDKAAENSYHWGVMVDATSGIHDERIVFRPVDAGGDERPKAEKNKFRTSAQRVLIGRKISEMEDAQATPVYLLRIDTGDRIGEIDVEVTITRHPPTPESEEYLVLEKAEGTVAGEPAEIDKNVFFPWRTLADERFYLDTGGLDNIDLESLY